MEKKEEKEEKEEKVGKRKAEEKEAEEKEGKEEKEEKKATAPEEAKEPDKSTPREINNGGYEVWMASDDDNDNTQSTTAVDTSQETIISSGSTAVDPDVPTTKSKTEPKPSTSSADPAIYQSTSAAPDDGILFSMPAGWNRMSLVLRDSGTLRFVKYVSRSAGADRWDVTCDWEIDWDATPEFEEGDGEDVGEEIGEEELARELEEEEEEQQRRMRRSTSEETTEEEVWGGVDSEEDEDDDDDEEEQENIGPAVGGKRKAVSQAGRFGKRRK